MPAARTASAHSRAKKSLPGFTALPTSPTRRAFGSSSRSNSSVFGMISWPSIETPVTLPPGRERLVTSPVPTGSPAPAMTIGTERVAFTSARTAGVPGRATITAGFIAASFRGKLGQPLGAALAQRARAGGHALAVAQLAQAVGQRVLDRELPATLPSRARRFVGA